MPTCCADFSQLIEETRLRHSARPSAARPAATGALAATDAPPQEVAAALSEDAGEAAGANRCVPSPADGAEEAALGNGMHAVDAVEEAVPRNIMQAAAELDGEGTPGGGRHAGVDIMEVAAACEGTHAIADTDEEGSDGQGAALTGMPAAAAAGERAAAIRGMHATADVDEEGLGEEGLEGAALMGRPAAAAAAEQAAASRGRPPSAGAGQQAADGGDARSAEDGGYR